MAAVLGVANLATVAESRDQWTADPASEPLTWFVQLLRVVLVASSPFLAGCVAYCLMYWGWLLCSWLVASFRTLVRPSHSIQNGLLPVWDRWYFDMFYTSEAPVVELGDDVIINIDQDQDAVWEDIGDGDPQEPPKWRITRDTPRLTYRD